MNRDDSVPHPPAPDGDKAVEDAAVKHEFLRCISIEADDRREEALQRLEQENRSVATEVRRLLRTLGSDVWAERISQFNPEGAVAPSLSDVGGEDAQAILDRTPNEEGRSIWEQTLSSSPNVMMTPEVETPITVSRSNQGERAGSDVDGRYRFDGEIARGGMGSVLKGRDTLLGRDLAVKVLLREHEGRTDSVRRFIEEAQIGGQLQHPGIAPVYDVGQLNDNRPFFTMKLIKGKTLSALLAERKSLEDDRVKLLGVFEQVCQTMAYAHSRNVLHRDLKPSNIMVGAFGEVQVMDWGLAKVMMTGGIAEERRAASGESPQSLIQTIRSVGSGTTAKEAESATGSQTRMGSVLGTPAYMPPEQAAGDVDRLDQRSDVFALGSILCEILTGYPVYRKAPEMDVLNKARLGDTSDALKLLQESSADADLIGLAVECLETEPADRPRDAQALSQRMSDHFASTDRRLRESEVEVARSATKAEEERKRRRVVIALATCAILAVLGGTIGWTRIERAQTRLAKIQADAEIADAADRSRLEQKIESELATADALAQPSSGLPSESNLLRAMEAIERARSLSTDQIVDSRLANRVESVFGTVATQQKDVRLLSRLREIWQIDRQYMALKNVPLVPNYDADIEPSRRDKRVGNSNDHPAADESAVDLAQTNPAKLYEQAFAEWGVSLAETSLREFSDRIDVFPDDQKTIVTVSLDRWRDLLSEPRTLRDWQLETWAPLTPLSFPNAAPTRFEVQPGNSILARGPLKDGGQKFVLETNQNKLSGLRLELLLHDSLPKKGPGRGGDGKFVLRGLRIVAHPNSNPQQSIELSLVDAVANHDDLSYPFKVALWYGWHAGGSPHVAYYRLATPLQDPKGFRLSISTEPRNSWESEQMIGHFRWSTTALRDRQSDRDLLNSLLARVDDDPWRKRFRKHRGSGDLQELVALTQDIESARRQPSILVALLTDRLMGLTGQELQSIYLDKAQWNHLTPSKVIAKNGTKYVIEDDQFIRAEGQLQTDEVAEVSLPVGLSATQDRWLRIQFSAWNGETNQNIGRSNRLLWLRELEVVPSADSFGGNLIDKVFADDSFNTPLERAVDGEFDRWYSMQSPDGPRSVFMRLGRREVENHESLILRLHTGYEYTKGYNPRRFQVSVATIPQSSFVPLDAVGSLLTDLWAYQPTDPSLRLQLSKYYLKRVPASRRDALTHSIAACSLSPDNLAAGLHLLDLVEVKDLISNAPLQSLVAKNFQRAADQIPGNFPCYYLQRATREHAISCFDQNRIQELRETTELILTCFDDPSVVFGQVIGSCIQLNQDYRRLHELLVTFCEDYLQAKSEERMLAEIHLRLGHQFYNQGLMELAAESYREAVRIAPANIEYRLYLGKCLNKMGDFQGAMEQEKQVLRLNPDDAIANNNHGVSFFKLEQYSNAVQFYQRAVSLEPDKALYRKNLGIGLIRLEDFEAASRAFDAAIANSADSAVAAHQLALQLLKATPLIDELGWNTSGTADAERTTDEVPESTGKERIRSFEVLEGIRLLTIAVQLEPSSLDYQRELGLACARAGQWEQAIEALETVSSRSTKDHASENQAYFLVLAIAHAEQGSIDQSRECFARGNAWAKIFDTWDEASSQLIEVASKRLELKESDLQQLRQLGYQSLVEHYEDEIERNPNDIGLVRTRGLVWFRWEKFEDAIPDLSKAIEFDKTDKMPRALRAECYRELGRYELALKDHTALIESDGHQNYRHFERAETYYLAGEYEQALSDIERGFEANAVDSASWFSLARARALAGKIYLRHLNQPEEALEHYNLALELEPDSTDYADGKRAALEALPDQQDRPAEPSSQKEADAQRKGDGGHSD